MLIKTENDWNIGKIWNPFTADYTKEWQEEIKKEKAKKIRSKQTLSMLLSFAGRHDFRRMG